jgi:hypothetical protein
VNQEKKNICEQLWLSAVKPTLIRVLGQRWHVCDLCLDWTIFRRAISHTYL